jgi:hypothetical protein
MKHTPGSFKFEVTRDAEGSLHMTSEGDGISVYEAIGFLEWKIRDLIDIQTGKVVPDTVTRTRVIP